MEKQVNEIWLKPDFLNPEQTTSLLQFMDERNGKGKFEPYENTVIFGLKYTPWHNRKIRNIMKYYRSYVSREFNLSLNYDQLVVWAPGAGKDLHKDGIDETNNEWVSVCYLNDDFNGGETVIEDQMIKPQRGGLAVFNSNNYYHGVRPADGWRFTYIAWWKKKG